MKSVEDWKKEQERHRSLALKWWNSTYRGQAEYHGLHDSFCFRAYSARKVRERKLRETTEKLNGIPEDAINICITMQIVGESVDFSDVESALNALYLASKEVKRLKIRREDFHDGSCYELPYITVIQYDRPVPKDVIAPAYITGGCMCDGDSAVICLDGEGETIAVFRGNGYSHEVASGGTSGMLYDEGTEYSVPEGAVAIVSYSADTINGGRKSAAYMFGDRRIAEKAIKEYRSSTSLWW